MGDAVAAEFLKSGILGAIIVALATVIAVFWRQRLKEQESREALQEMRVKEARDYAAMLATNNQTVMKQLIEAHQTAVAALTSATNAIEANQAMLVEVRQVLRDSDDNSNNRRPRRP